MNKEKFEKSFNKEFARLNDAQKEAVLTIEGPVMTVAGPGTGKTQVVALRIAEILLKTQLDAKNILALTFTDAGVTALRDRLESIAGPIAYQVTISTFHSFAKSIIDSFPYLVSYADSFDQTSEAEQYTILSSIISKNPNLKYLRPMRSPQWHINAISKNLQTLKRESIESENLRKCAKDIEKQAGIEKTKTKKEPLVKQAGVLKELADIYDEYQKHLKEKGLYDYDDVILLATSLIRDNADVRAFYQEKFQYILADEYQDTNNAQNELVTTLADFFDNPNLFVVGDDKQAIFRFQGASVANMLFFKDRYPEMKVVTLKENYRSHSLILSIANELISNNQNQIQKYIPEIDTEVFSQKLQTGETKLIETQNQIGQYCWIVDKIKKLLDNGMSADEIAVIFRTNAEVDALGQLALKNGIPIAGKNELDVLKKPKIMQLITLLRAIDAPFKNEFVFPTLRAINNKIDSLTLMKLCSAFQWSDKSLAQSVNDISQSRDYEVEEVKNAISKLMAWNAFTEEANVADVLEKIITESDYLRSIKGSSSELDKLAQVSAFLEEAKRFSIREGKTGIKDFLLYLDNIATYGLQLTIEKVQPKSDGVKISTIHGVKGLEYSAVFVGNVSDDKWGKERRAELIHLPAELIGLKNWHEDVLEEERRLFYVAITRAKDYLFLSYSKMDDSGKTHLPCQFVSEIKDLIPFEESKLDEEAIKPIWCASLEAPKQELLTKQELAYVREIISSRPLSPTALSKYRLCPQQFLLYQVLGFPQKDSPVLAYGNAIHKTMESFFRLFKSSGKLPDNNMLGKLLAESIQRQLGLTKEEKEIYLKSGLEVLIKYCDKYKDGWKIPVDLEYKFRSHNVKIGDVWVTGNFDRIDLLDPVAKTVRVVDYKTGGTSKTRGEIEGTTQNSEGDIKKQLVFYAMLAKRSPRFPFIAKEFTISFIDDKETFKEETFIISDSEIKALEDEVVETYKELLTRTDFNHTRESYDRGCDICQVLE